MPLTVETGVGANWDEAHQTYCASLGVFQGCGQLLISNASSCALPVPLVAEKHCIDAVG